MFNKLHAFGVFVIASLFVSSLATATFPWVKKEGDRVATIADEMDGALEVTPLPMADSGAGLACESTNHRLYIDYSRDGFTSVTQVREWCNGFMSQFGIDSSRFDDHCGWTRSGTYGRYTYNGNFVYYQDYAGQPRFYFQAFCGD
jgi:hypothetical protein